MKRVYVTGHRNPDSDSICSALAYADFKNRHEGVEAIAMRLGKISLETQYILDYFKLEGPKFIGDIDFEGGEDLVLVDHNERGQSVENIEDFNLVEILDHHRIADLITNKPIYFRTEPIGSTASLVAKKFFEIDEEPSKEIAGLLCGALISDTLLFRSPTSTEEDREILARLVKIADIDPEKFANDMFKAGTSIEGKTSDELLNQDFKEFNFGENFVGIGQVFTMDFDKIREMKEELLETMNRTVEERNYQACVLVLTDIFNETSEILVAGEKKDQVAKAFKASLVDSSFSAPGVLSRKKQVVPPITEILG